MKSVIVPCCVGGTLLFLIHCFFKKISLKIVRIFSLSYYYYDYPRGQQEREKN